jgi:hypothetical protein
MRVFAKEIACRRARKQTFLLETPISSNSDVGAVAIGVMESAEIADALRRRHQPLRGAVQRLVQKCR